MRTLELHPDYGASGTPFAHTWAGLANVLQFHFFLRKDIIDQLRQARDEIGVRHVRAVGMFDDAMHVYAPTPATDFGKQHPQPVENWSQVDIAIENLLEIGVKPMFTTCFTPSRMASGSKHIFTRPSNVTPPKDLAQWRQFVRHSVEHAVTHFGHQEVRSWYFEVWNEPNLMSFWSSDQNHWFELWRATYSAIKEVDSEIRVGGPSSARGEWLQDLIEYGRRHDCEPDYIITHIYNNDSESEPLSPFDGSNVEKTSKSPHFASGVVRGARRLLDQLDYKGDVHWNEWGRSWFPYYPERETPSEAAFIAKTMAEVSQCADSFAYWNLTDIYDHVGFGVEAFHGYYGLLNREGLRKPNYVAHQLLCRLGTESLPIEAKGGDRLTGALLTRSKSGYQLLVYAYLDPEVQGVDTTESCQVKFPVPADATSVRAYPVDATHNNILAEWREMGSPTYLSREQRETLHQSNSPTHHSESLKWDKDSAHAVADLEAPGMMLIEIDCG